MGTPRFLAFLLCVSAIAIWATSAKAASEGIDPALLAKAKAGDAEAQFEVGNTYNYGDKVDYAQALIWYRKGAEQGNADSQFQLGGLYHFGHGVPQDDGQAFNWIVKAARQGHIDAEFYIATCYASAWGVPASDAKRVIWLRRAAEQGDSRSQLYLALAYGTGTGVAKDDSEAYFWFAVAASRETDSGRKENDVKGRFHTGALLTPTELSHAQNRVQKWLEDHPAQSTMNRP